ncbi:MAG: ArsR family transcriptional regulator [Clostridia bacterium]|nr:ArsR family transcriptional regulator [Clostridia bacterium]
MDEMEIVLKALADNSRILIVKLLLRHNCCVRALARHLNLTEAAVSQHLKVLREAELITGEKRGYFMHYEVNREKLRQLAANIEALADIQIESERPDGEGCCHK